MTPAPASPVTHRPRLEPRIREPALAAATFLGLGIAADRAWSWPMAVWVGLAALAIGLAWWVSRRQLSGRVLATALVLLAAGGAWHHQFWSQRSTQDIAALPTVATPVRIEGVLTAPATTRKNNRPGVPSWLRVDQTILLLKCERLLSHDGSAQPVTGLLRVSVTGHVLDLFTGDRVQVLGVLATPEPPEFEGEFHYPNFLLAQGIDRLLRADHPDTVTRIERPATLGAQWGRGRERVRREASQLFFDHLPPTVRPVAESLLLGDRTDMREATSDAFIRSGTMHILAISGMHIAALAGFVVILCRLANLQSTTAAVVIGLTILAYAGLVENRPPVTRAVVLGMLTLLASVTSRRSQGLQALALSALILLIRNPSDLFDVGAQLSFVAVAIIIVTTQWLSRRQRETFTDRLLEGERPWLSRVAAQAGRWLVGGYLITAMVWLGTAPILIRTFHLVSPAGLLVNALLTPLSTLVLCLGFLFLGVGLLCPPLAGWAVIPFRWSLELFVSSVEWVAAWPGSSGNAPAPSLTWMIGFYACLLGTVLFRSVAVRRWTARGALIWTAGWLAVASWPVPPGPELTCTVLDVGHGGAILIECPNGRTMLYDCGSMGDGRRAAEAVRLLLEQRGRSRIDVLVISHADHDHYNGGIDLAARVRIGTVLFAPQSIDFEQEQLEQLFQTLSAQGSPLRVAFAGDRIPLDPQVALEILHPTPEHQASLDNAQSLVLRVTFAGRSILLTGDLEREGLQRLLSLPRQPVDLLLAPHHGGRSANTPALADWADPQWVFVSNRTDNFDRVSEVYRRSPEIHSTAREGSLTFMIHPDGRLRFQSSQKIIEAKTITAPAELPPQ